MDNATFTRTLQEHGADLVGVADLALLQGLVTLPDDLLRGFTRAVSLAVKISDSVIDAVTVVCGVGDPGGVTEMIAGGRCVAVAVAVGGSGVAVPAGPCRSGARARRAMPEM